ncbi:hypothetical protein KC951_02945 [Candidatus Saccharibacteria bacterium]|nr:hypothetical protein [Candidatus Saccharibacteria bacterium]
MQLYISHLLSFVSQIANCEQGTGNSASCDTNLPEVAADAATFQTILGIVFAGIGVAAVAFIFVGAFRYVTSGGDSEAAKNARNTILYAVIGLAVAVSAEAIVVLFVSKI